MLTIEQIKENKTTYLALIRELNEEQAVLDKLESYLNSARVDFFNKPFGTKPDVAYPGSLCEHSLNLYKELTKLCNLYAPNEYSNIEIIKVALFKDLYRAEMYESFNRNVKNDETGKWESVVAYRVKEERPCFGDVAFSSYMIAKKFINLDNDEIVEAICRASDQTLLDSYEVRQSYKLVTLTQMAELATSYIKEQQN